MAENVVHVFPHFLPFFVRVCDAKGTVIVVRLTAEKPTDCVSNV
jgi:hypothetical protein